jgi:hypothetical protein
MHASVAANKTAPQKRVAILVEEEWVAHIDASRDTSRISRIF